MQQGDGVGVGRGDDARAVGGEQCGAQLLWVGIGGGDLQEQVRLARGAGVEQRGEFGAGTQAGEVLEGQGVGGDGEVAAEQFVEQRGAVAEFGVVEFRLAEPGADAGDEARVEALGVKAGGAQALDKGLFVGVQQVGVLRLHGIQQAKEVVPVVVGREIGLGGRGRGHRCAIISPALYQCRKIGHSGFLSTWTGSAPAVPE
ncbi:hypothetical protein E4634_13840 [Mangrovimicrobium sediminis]|uniref:Uncharacterized protein n=1 Tax=Mangrovimicrobium sediminis TaxID=2562682 RepID=A0A4Z0LZ26_9GAMM|nr:hypothetical protein E4634_13840 [Haliea sp. SAOS-164]